MEFIPASFYRPLFYGILTLIACFIYSKYYLEDRDESIYDNSKLEFVLAMSLAVFLTFFFGNRPYDGSDFGDTYGMALEYETRKLYIGKFVWDWESENVIFDNMYNFFASRGYSHSTFFTIIAAIYFFSILFACNKFFPKHILLSYITCLFSFVAFGNIVNGFKGGAASAIFLLAFSYREKNLLFSIILALIAWGFHHAFHLCLYTFIAVHFLRSPKVNFFIWSSCVIISALNITYFQDFFSQYTDDVGSSYLMTKEAKLEELGVVEGYYTGFRIDFLIYSFMPILLGYVAIVKKNIHDKSYKFLLNYYLIANSIWVLCMYASFTNRIAALSWFLYPILLIYPFLRCDWRGDKYRTLSIICLAQMIFTLFMSFVYHSV